MTKKWYLSKTIWGITLAFVMALAQLFGITPGELTPELVNVLQMISLLVGLYGRVVAKKAIE